MREMELQTDWIISRLGELGKLVRGVTYSKEDVGIESELDYVPLIRATNIQDRSLNLESDLVWIKKQKVADAQQLKVGDIVIAMSSGSKSVVGKAAQLSSEWFGSFGGFCAAFRPNTKVIDQEFIGLVFQSNLFRGHIEKSARGTNIYNLSKDHILGFEVFHPRLSEQRAIARALRAVQKAKETRQRELLLERERKTALMQYLFTHGTRSERRKQAEGGEIPSSWKLVNLGELITFGPQNGLYKPASYYGEGVPILRIDAFQSGEILTQLNLKRLRLSAQELQTFKLREADLVINRVNGNVNLMGKCALIGNLGEPTVFESNMMRLAVDTVRVSPRFLLWFLCTAQAREQIRSKARIINQASINQQDIRSLIIPLPHMSEQEEIADVIAACDSKIKTLEVEIDLLIELFATALEELMTGRLSAVPLIV